MSVTNFLIPFPDEATLDKGIMCLAKRHGWTPEVKQAGVQGQPATLVPNPLSPEKFVSNVLGDIFKKAMAEEDGRIAAEEARAKAEEAVRALNIG